MAEKKLKLYSIAEYLMQEEQAMHKSEFEQGQIRALSGGTLNHGIIGNNINTSLNNSLREREKNCIAINGDVRIWIEQAQSFVYLDAMLICGEIERSEKDPHAVVNPVLIVEVLSKSTESYDRGNKFHKYCSLPSFREYVLIDQTKPVVDVLYRADAAYWKMVTTIGLDKSIYINTLDYYIPLKDIYRNTQDLLNPPFQLDF